MFSVMKFGCIAIVLYSNAFASLVLFDRYFDSGIRLALVSEVKNRLVQKTPISDEFSKKMEEIVLYSGAKTFDGLMTQLQESRQTDLVQYLRGKYLFSQNKLLESAGLMQQVSSDSNIFAHAQFVLGTINALKSNASALDNFTTCEKSAQELEKKLTQNPLQHSLWSMLADYCRMGIARFSYNQGQWAQTQESYLTIGKKNYLWPIILQEEGWAAFYRAEYNRTLGKVVTYRASQLKYAFQPESAVLQGMAFLKLCLYDDALKTVNSFYDVYDPLLKYLEGTLRQNQGSNSLFYQKSLVKFSEEDSLYGDLLRGIKKSSDIRQLLLSIEQAKEEQKIVALIQSSADRKALQENIQDYLETSSELLGKLIFLKLKRYKADLEISMKGMSYIKLEVLGKQKKMIYTSTPMTGPRGDVRYLKRTSAQYFWNFNKEFWADELGDYIFAMASECPTGQVASKD
jgi:hypothetical protein